MAFTERSAFTSLPPELLHHIFTFLSPTDLSSLCMTSRIFYNYINSSDYLWTQIYNQYWDTPLDGFTDSIVSLSCPKRKLLRRSKGKVAIKDDVELKLDSRNPNKIGTFNPKEQAQRRVWAERRLSSLQSRQIDLYANYNSTLQSLLSIVRSRRPRQSARDQITASQSNTYLKDLLTSSNSSDTFRRVIYPRLDARRLREWQIKSMCERFSNSSKLPSKNAEAGGKRPRPTSIGSNSILRQKKRKQQSDAANDDRLQRRRSARLLLGAYPFELHHLLSDSQGNNLVDLDDERGVSGLEDIDLIDEQLAAELHVLHGILPNKVPPEDVQPEIVNNSEADSSAPNEEEDDDDESDSDFMPAEEEEEDQEDLNYQSLPAGTSRDFSGVEEQSRLRGHAREIVYDTARFGPENAFGPFLAYRERWAPLDGIRTEDVRSDNETDGEGDGDGEEENDSTEASEEEDEDVEVVEEEDAGVNIAELQDGLEAFQELGGNLEELEDEDEDFEVDRDDEDDDDMLFEGRELLIAASRGILPYYESERLKKEQSENSISLPRPSDTTARLSLDEEAREISEMIPNTKPLDKVWRIEKRIDWVVVESIMVCMHANITHSVKDHYWGRHFNLPGNIKSLNGEDEETARLNSTLGMKRWQNILGLPCGWSHSRGDSSRMPSTDLKETIPKDGPSRKPFDWAGVECSWIGTYSFLDWSRWAAFNARDPASRGIQEEVIATDPSKPFLRGDSTKTPSLRYEREAIGDCLQLQMELLPMEEQHPVTFQQRALEELEGQSSSRYPPLRFRGRTRTYDQEPPIPRGLVHGIVRPIFAPVATQEIGSNDRRAIIGMDWSISHSYEGEDRWSLSGVQPGPPGSRAPIYGIWGSSRRTDALSPCGPFIYYRVD